MSGSNSTFSVGKDVSFVLVGPTGIVQLPALTEFSADPQYDTFKSKPLSGTTRQFDLPDGWMGSAKFDREDNSVDSFFAAIEAAYLAVGGFVPVFTGYQYITERDGSQSTYQFSETTLKYKAGSWKSGAPVAGSIEFYARVRTEIQ